jgi:hypothetical protein
MIPLAVKRIAQPHCSICAISRALKDVVSVQLPVNTLRTRIKRLVRWTICLSKTEHRHDVVMGLFINRSEFGRPI